MNLLDISVTNAINNGKTRKGRTNFKKVIPRSTNDIEIWNPYRTAINHRKHEGKVYREAIGGFETKGKPRYHPDAYEY